MTNDSHNPNTPSRGLAQIDENYPEKHTERVAAVAERTLADRREVDHDREVPTIVSRPDPQRVAKMVALTVPGAEYHAESRIFHVGKNRGGTITQRAEIGVIELAEYEVWVYRDRVEVSEVEETGDER